VLREDGRYFAHSKNAAGLRHELVEHLLGTAERAARFAAAFGAANLGYLAGLWHDLGKFNPTWQAYLVSQDSPHPLPRGGDHKGAGSLFAAEHCSPLEWLIQGHHGGLRNHADLNTFLTERRAATEVADALRIAAEQVPELTSQGATELPAHAREDRLAGEFFLRMLFSALVDADFLDTEAHFDVARSARRANSSANLARLFDRLDRDQEQFRRRPIPDASRERIVSEARQAIYAASVEAAERAPGVFALTAPTGTGKTRAMMAFALRHAAMHGLRRVVIAVPFISITEQSAQTYRDIFDEQTVLEHHSAASFDEDVEEGATTPSWHRLAAETGTHRSS
jgi:CRISPR-associated endonuclease/helicase Cas3